MLKGERRGGRSAIRMHFSGGLSKAGWENAKNERVVDDQYANFL